MLIKRFATTCVLTLAAMTAASHAQGRSPLEGHVPLYLSGIVSTILWGEPGARMDLQTRPEHTAPDVLLDLLVRRPGVDLGEAEKVVREALPGSDTRVWRVLLPSLAQLTLADVPRPEVGGFVTVIGHPVPSRDGTPTLKSVVMLIGGAAYALPEVASSDAR